MILIVIYADAILEGTARSIKFQNFPVSAFALLLTYPVAIEADEKTLENIFNVAIRNVPKNRIELAVVDSKV